MRANTGKDCTARFSIARCSGSSIAINRSAHVMLTSLLVASLSVAALLHLWFRTNVVPQYADFLGLGRVFKTNDYYAAIKKADGQGNYPGFLLGELAPRGRILSFLGSLLSCPNCLGMWFALAVCLPFGLWPLTLAVYYLALLVFRHG